MYFRHSAQSVTSQDLSKLIEGRKLNNAKMARILGVEGWTVGAWLSGKREISEKHKERIFELIHLPENSDLILAPTAKQLASRMGQIDEVADRPHVIEAMVQVNKAAARTLLQFSPSNIDPTELDAFDGILKAYDDHSIAQLNQRITSILVERVRIAAADPKMFAKECMERANKGSGEFQLALHDSFISADLALDYDEEEQLYELQDDLHSDFGSRYFDPEMGPRPIFHPETGKCLLNDEDRKEALQEIRDRHEDFVKDEAYKLFQDTGFEEDRTNHQWLDSTSYMATYTIDFEHPGFKESLRVVMDRRGIE